ncbi:hypothetical protein GJ744_004293 [Endocarpon pusillum]|uniref:Uncharacterized protein n=1 Tax=Endocarpon pusillum TaxID=364733 RepID=A0A8H7A9N6_9EURO|nr:hypothetical protein GJ744_004293 [Endocarpon pusillum]
MLERLTSCLSSVTFWTDRDDTSVPQGYKKGAEAVDPISSLHNPPSVFFKTSLLKSGLYKERISHRTTMLYCSIFAFTKSWTSLT